MHSGSLSIPPAHFALLRPLPLAMMWSACGWNFRVATSDLAGHDSPPACLRRDAHRVCCGGLRCPAEMRRARFSTRRLHDHDVPVTNR